jgi:1,4-dihydroxy-2-naphthoate octaprenyltransferase
MATRPFAYTASALAVAIGAAISHYSGVTTKWGLLSLTMLGVLSFHTAANLLNDCFDHQRGLDTEVLPLSGAVIRGWLTEQQVIKGAIICLLIGILCGAALIVNGGWPVLALGTLGTICALGYTTPRFCFKYSGKGDAAIFLAFGFLPVFGTWWVQTSTFSWLPVLWSLPIAMLAVGILHSNNWRDLDNDARNACITIAGRLGPSASRRYFQFLILGPFGLVLAISLMGMLSESPLSSPPHALAVFAAFPYACKLAAARPDRDPALFPVIMAKTAQLHLLFGLLCAVGFVVGSKL